MQFEEQLKKVKFLEEPDPELRFHWGIYSFMIDGREEEIQVIVDNKERKIYKNLLDLTKFLNQQETVIFNLRNKNYILEKYGKEWYEDESRFDEYD